MEPPFIPGHEILGRVAEVGPDYKGPFKLGDRIVSEQIVPCGTCRYCREDKYWLCDPHNVYGFKYFLNGGFAKYVRLPGLSRNHLVPEDLPMEKAILIEPFALLDARGGPREDRKGRHRGHRGARARWAWA